MIKTWLKRQTRKLEGDFLGSLGAVMFLVEYLNIYLILQLCFLFVSSFVQLPVASTTNFWRTFVEVVALVFLGFTSFPENQESKKGTDEG